MPILRSWHYFFFFCIGLLSALVIEASGTGQQSIAAIPPANQSIATLQATTYYISPSGDDNNSGTSEEVPWQTIKRVNRVALHPGDSVLFQGGATFAGGLSLDRDDRGTPDHPILISSYGGRATLEAKDSDGIFIYNTSGYLVKNLNLDGSGWQSNPGSGINFYNDLPGNVKLEAIQVENVDISGFGQHGIAIGSWNQKSGYQNVQISHISTHNNGKTGLLTYAQIPNVHEKVQVTYVQAYDNFGVPGDPNPTGSGIVLGGVNGGMIDRCVAHHNGNLNDATSGPVGIWTYDSTNVTIQHSESYQNRTGRAHDGGGFDLDQNVSQSVIQYNYSHDNDGAGYLLAHGLADPVFTNNVIRYNISQNDGRKNKFAGIHLYGQIRNTEIYNNTVFVNAALTGNPSAVRVENPSVEALKVRNVHFYNNIFQTTDGLTLIDISPDQSKGTKDLNFQGNAYYSTDKNFSIHWGEKIYSSLAAWQRETKQERLNSTSSGFSVNPQLLNPGGGTLIGNPDLLYTLNAYQLKPTSPLIDAGLNLKTLFSLNTGKQDFYGTSLPQGTAYELGVYEKVADR